jgi:hypothetical protein
LFVEQRARIGQVVGVIEIELALGATRMKHVGRPSAAARVVEHCPFIFPMHEIIRDEHVVALGMRGGIHVVLALDQEYVRIGHRAVVEDRVLIGVAVRGAGG